MVAVPIGCLAYSTLRTAFGVARRLSEPAVLRTGCIARLTDFGKNPRRKLTSLSLLWRRLRLLARYQGGFGTTRANRSICRLEADRPLAPDLSLEMMSRETIYE